MKRAVKQMCHLIVDLRMGDTKTKKDRKRRG